MLPRLPVTLAQVTHNKKMKIRFKKITTHALMLIDYN